MTTPEPPKQRSEPHNDEPSAIAFNSPGVFDIHNPATSHDKHWQNSPADANIAIGQNKALHLYSQEAIRDHVYNLIKQARREICIYSTDLEPWLYHDTVIYDLCKAFVLRHQRNRLRILLQDTSGIARDGHRLLPLIERLNSRCSLKVVHPEYEFFDSNWLAIDQQALLIRKIPAEKNALVLYYDPIRAEQKRLKFEAMWAVARFDINLRRLLL